MKIKLPENIAETLGVKEALDRLMEAFKEAQATLDANPLTDLVAKAYAFEAGLPSSCASQLKIQIGGQGLVLVAPDAETSEEVEATVEATTTKTRGSSWGNTATLDQIRAKASEIGFNLPDPLPRDREGKAALWAEMEAKAAKAA
jgi:inosine-uridine nucleoside N-ribohydrolase